MDLLLEFGRTGRIGAVRPGMTLAEAQELLGPGTPHVAYRALPDANGYPYRWGSLSMNIWDGVALDVTVNVTPGGLLHVPTELWPGLNEVPGTFEREAVLKALEDGDCPFEVDESLTLTHAMGVRTKAGTAVTFFHRETSDKIEKSGYYLGSVYRQER
ncbi:MAG TPA: hypothetical protein VF821_16405 [Lentzea sp.]